MLFCKCHTKTSTTHSTKFMVHTEEMSVRPIPNLKWRALFFHNKKKSKLGHVTPATPIMVRTQAGSVLHLCTKLKADSLIRSKVIRDPKISKLGHVTLSHPPFEPETLNLCRYLSAHAHCQILCF